MIVYTLLYRHKTDKWLLFVVLAVCLIDLTDLPTGDESIEIIYLVYMFFGVLLASMIFFARHLFYVAELKWRLYLYVHALKKIVDTIFDCYLNANYPLNRYVYEKRIHDAKNTALCISANLSGYIKALPFPNSDRLTPVYSRKQQCDDIFLLLLDSGQLRHRISDHTTFRFCADELKKIKDFLLMDLTKLQFNILKEINVSSSLDDAMNPLEGIYEMVLQVVAREPISFLLFIQDMRGLSSVIENGSYYANKY